MGHRVKESSSDIVVEGTIKEKVMSALDVSTATKWGFDNAFGKQILVQRATLSS